jgi:hypothetical protein
MIDLIPDLIGNSNTVYYHTLTVFGKNGFFPIIGWFFGNMLLAMTSKYCTIRAVYQKPTAG